MKRILLLTALTIALLCGCTAPVDVDESSPAPAEIKQVEPLKVDEPAGPPQSANRVEGCTVTYYCCEPRPHICGTGDGITASGAPVEAGVSCAVDPALIPLGSTVWVDYGDGELHEYIAQDTGGAVNGAHIDLAVATHDEALDMGVQTATVYWLEG